MSGRKGNRAADLGGKRGAAAYGRRGPVREPRATVLIVCEGESTEPSYFRELKRRARLTNVNVVVQEGHGGSTRGVVEHAVRLARQDDYDEIWCVIDTEVLATNSTFESAVALAASKGIRLAVSNPAFEYWYLLHLRDTNRAFASVEQLITVLKTFLPEYEKSAGYLPPIFAHTETATSRAETYRQRHVSASDPYPHPSTNVYELVRLLKPTPLY